MTAKVISVGASKGGVGKTTISTNIALCLLTVGYVGKGRRRQLSRTAAARRVLIVDMDRQRSAGDSLGLYGIPAGSSYAMAIAGEEVDLDNCIFQVPFDVPGGRLDVMPIAAYDYEAAVAALPGYPNNGLDVITDLLAPVMDDYDYIILDLRPELSHLTSSAMAASTGGVLVPVTSELTTAIHTQDIVDHLAFLEEATKREVRSLGVVRTRWDAKTEEARDVNALLKDLEVRVFNTIIPNHRAVSKSFALSSGPVVTSYPKAPASQKFYELAGEVLDRIEGVAV